MLSFVRPLFQKLKELTVGNLKLSGNTIKSVDTNGNVIFQADGWGEILFYSWMNLNGNTLQDIGGTTAAQSGVMRFANNKSINARNSGNSADFGITFDSNNRISVDTGINLSNSSSILDAGTAAIEFDGSQNVSIPNGALNINASATEKGALSAGERSSDPSNPPEGEYVMWMSDGTGSGADGDIMMKITAGSTTKTTTLVDFSAV